MADKALKRLYVAHQRDIRAYLTNRLRDPAIADDLTQEAFLRLAETGTADVIVNGRSWLYRAAHNLAVDHVRQVRRQRTDQADDGQLAAIPEDRPAVDEAAAARHALDRLRDVLEELPERTQRVFVLIRIDGLTYSEAADRLGVSESSVQKHLSRALRHVVERMKAQ